MKNQLILSIIIICLCSINVKAQTEDEKEGLKILNLLRRNYSQPPLQYDKELSEYAEKKAMQQVNNDLEEIIVSRETVGLLWFAADDLNELEIKDPLRYASTVLEFIDIDCDEKNKYDLFNQVIDEKSSKIGIAEYLNGNSRCIVFVFDNYVYNEETDSPNY